MSLINSTRRFSAVLSDPHVGGLSQAFLIMCGIFVALAALSSGAISGVLGAIGAGFAGGVVWAIRTGYQMLDDRQEGWLNASAESWAKNGKDVAEVKSRMSLIQSLGAESALREAGHLESAPILFNIDGTPMNGMLDMHGCFYGQSNPPTTQFDGIDLGTSYIETDMNSPNFGEVTEVK